MHIENHRLFAPFYIFVKDKSKLSDDQLLEKLDLKHYKPVLKKEDQELPDKQYLYISDDGNWKHLMDDCSYGLWHELEIGLRIEGLSKEFDIYSCSIGDIDDSYEFVYYKDGIKIREYEVKDYDFDGGIVVKNSGQALEFEQDALAEKEVLDKVLAIAKSIGIHINHNAVNIRCYAKELKTEIV